MVAAEGEAAVEGEAAAEEVVSPEEAAVAVSPGAAAAVFRARAEDQGEAICPDHPLPREILIVQV